LKKTESNKDSKKENNDASPSKQDESSNNKSDEDLRRENLSALSFGQKWKQKATEKKVSNLL